MDKVTPDDIKAYCDTFGLVYVSDDYASYMEEEEWVDTEVAGIMPGANLVFVLWLTPRGRCRMVRAWADGIKHLEDKFRTVTREELMVAVGLKKQLHPE